MQIKSPRFISSLFFLVFLVAQFLIFLKYPWEEPWQGDEPGYVRTAEVFLHKEGAEASNFRPPGYPLFIAICNAINFNPLTVRYRCGVMQFFLISIVFQEVEYAPARGCPMRGSNPHS